MNVHKEKRQMIGELRNLAWVAHEMGSPFLLRGSVAREILRNMQERKSHPDSLLELVPPLSDIDLTVEESVDSDLWKLLREAVPHSVFFKIEIEREEFGNEEISQKANLQIRQDPVIRFGPSGGELPMAGRKVVRSFSLGSGGQLVQKGPWRCSPSVKLLPDKSRLGAKSGLLRDLIFLRVSNYAGRLDLGSREPVASQTAQELSALGAGSFSELLKREPREFLRTTFALLEYLVRAAVEVPSAGYLGLEVDFFRTLGDAFPGTGLAKLCRALAKPRTRDDLVAVISPRTDEPVSHFSGTKPSGETEAVQTPGDSEPQSVWFESDVDQQKERHLLERVLPDASEIPRLATPLVPIAVGAPPEPACCRYQDFRNGRGELVWRSAAPLPPEACGTVLATVYPLPSGRWSYSHAFLATSEKASSMRFDPGFLSLVNGRSGQLRMVVGSEDVGS